MKQPAIVSYSTASIEVRVNACSANVVMVTTRAEVVSYCSGHTHAAARDTNYLSIVAVSGQDMVVVM